MKKTPEKPMNFSPHQDPQVGFWGIEFSGRGLSKEKLHIALQLLRRGRDQKLVGLTEKRQAEKLCEILQAHLEDIR